MLQFPMGKKVFRERIIISTGQSTDKRYMRYLRDLITSRVASPSFVVSHEFKIDESLVAYENSTRVEGYTKGLNSPTAKAEECCATELEVTGIIFHLYQFGTLIRINIDYCVDLMPNT
jgi:hypothetical protein